MDLKTAVFALKQLLLFRIADAQKNKPYFSPFSIARNEHRT